MNILVISPKIGEDSAKRLALNLNAKYINPFKTEERDFSKFTHIINYGFSRKIKGTVIINKPQLIQITRDKVKCFKLLKDKCNTVPFTEDKNLALYWINIGRTVVARTLTKADNGKGLIYCNTKENIEDVHAKFYTRFTPHVAELRVNVWKGKILSIYHKKRNKGFFDFLLLREKQFVENMQIIQIVEKIYKEIPIDWCGIDLLLSKDGTLFFLEINSAPILYQYTLKKLTSIIKKEIE